MVLCTYRVIGTECICRNVHLYWLCVHVCVCVFALCVVCVWCVGMWVRWVAACACMAACTCMPVCVRMCDVSTCVHVLVPCVTYPKVIEPGQALQAGQIYDSNKTTLMAALREQGFECSDAGLAEDE